jgi:hypothetical protein
VPLPSYRRPPRRRPPALFADGPGSLNVAATLALADGYNTSFSNFDPQAHMELQK